MESIHFDIAMPPGYHAESYGNYRYVVNFVDDKTGYMYCVPLVSKADLPDALKSFLLYARQYGDVRRLRSDQALENDSQYIKKICETWGIHHNFSGTYAPPPLSIGIGLG